MDVSMIRLDIVESLDQWAASGVPTGDFLRAVLSNNLFEAVCRADDDNIKVIVEICRYIYNELPAGCHGSPEKVKAWAEMKAKERAAG